MPYSAKKRQNPDSTQSDSKRMAGMPGMDAVSPGGILDCLFKGAVPALPQNDKKNSAKRAKEISERQEKYEVIYST
jgi:hypothetical protein